MKNNKTDVGAIDVNANTAPNANAALSSMDSDTPRPSENDISSCIVDGNQASKRDLDRTKVMCTQGSPEKPPIVPEIPNILNLGVKNRISNEGFMVPWDGSPCYPPYTIHLCCSGPAIPLDWLSRLYAEVAGCSPCSFGANALYSFRIMYQLT